MKTHDVILKLLKYFDDHMDDDRIDLEEVSSEALGISENRLSRIVAMMTEERLLADVEFIPVTESFVDWADLRSARITLRGIQYIEDSTTTAKIINAAKLLKDVIPMA